MDNAVATVKPTNLLSASPTTPAHGLGGRWQSLPGRIQLMARLGVAALLAVLGFMFTGGSRRHARQ